MPYVTSWDEQAEVEVLPNNFRRSVAGHKVGINKIRLVHPSGTPLHHHDLEEQAVMIAKGELDVVIAGVSHIMKAGDVCVIPAQTEHCFRTTGADCELIEVFAPMRIQNLVGFLGKNF